ncbi:hypothetical protein BU16DRAFT_339417 [Lophium mytilinum]|uniref:Uncharacterized protein n=1 Tax=Lophium mytilinum TaxID=390894 RepID=A0A6A6QW69_9PEZI|nr:hypothetical protein BU16DRAFT_339417 [Lophium mytilinum]
MAPLPHLKPPHAVTGQERLDLLWMSFGILLGLLSVAAISAARIHFVGDPVKKYSQHVKQLQDRDSKNQSLQQQVDNKDHTIATLTARVARHEGTIDAQVRNIEALNDEIDDKRNRIQELEVGAIPLRRLQAQEPELRRHIAGMESELVRLRAIRSELEDLRPRVGEMRDRDRTLRRQVQEKDTELQESTSRNEVLVQRMAYMQQRLAATGHNGR